MEANCDLNIRHVMLSHLQLEYANSNAGRGGVVFSSSHGFFQL